MLLFGLQGSTLEDLVDMPLFQVIQEPSILSDLITSNAADHYY